MNLPFEIYLQIFKLLDKATVSNCAIVCKDWTLPAFQVYYKEITVNERCAALKALLNQEQCFKYCQWTEKVCIFQGPYFYQRTASKPKVSLTKQEFLKFFEYFPNLKVIKVLKSDCTKFLLDIDSSHHLTRLQKIIFDETECHDLHCSIYYNFRASLVHVSLYHENRSLITSQYNGILSYLSQFKKLTHLTYCNNTKYYVSIYEVQVACPSLTSIEIEDWYTIPPSFQVDDNPFYHGSNLKELSISFANIYVNHVEHIIKYLPQSVESLRISINDIDLYDWTDQVGIDNVLKLAELMSKLSSSSLEWIPYKYYQREHESIDESDMTVYFKILNAFKGDKKVSCIASFSDFRSVHNRLHFSNGNLRVSYGLNYEDLYVDSGEERVLEFAVPDKTVSVIGPEVINNLTFYICTSDTDLTFKALKYSLINCPYLQHVEFKAMNSPHHEFTLSSSIDNFRGRNKKYDSSATSIDILKAIKLKNYIPSQKFIDLLSYYLPGIQIISCKTESYGFIDDEVTQDYIVDLTLFKNLDLFYFDLQLILCGSKTDTCLVKLECVDGEERCYRYRDGKVPKFELVSLENIQSTQISTINTITFKCERIEKFAFLDSNNSFFFQVL